MTRASLWQVPILVMFVAALASCGGGGGSSSSPEPEPTVTVSVSPSSADVPIGQSVQFSASVSETSNSQVNWRVAGIPGGNETVGRIDANGLYTAPVTVPEPSKVTVTAISREDSGQSGSATVEILATFSEATIEGRYIFRNVGITANTRFIGVGSWVADGEGNLTGAQDLNNGDRFITNISVDGTYSLDESGRGTSTVTTPDGTFELVNIMEDASHGYYIAVDEFQVLVGEFWRQDASAREVAVFDSPFAFEFSGTGPSGEAVRSIGVVDLDGTGDITGGRQALNQGGSINTTIDIVGGSYDFAHDTGRGPATVETSLSSNSFMIQVIDDDRVIFLSRDPGFPVTGKLHRKQSGDISEASLAGDFVFGANGVTQAGDIATIGRFTSDGLGNLDEGRLDTNEAGAVLDGIPFSGTYSVSASGRGNASLNISDGSAELLFEVIDSERLVFMQTDPDQVIGGIVVAQEGEFINEALSGPYALIGSGVVENDLVTVAGIAEADGGGILNLELDLATFDFDTNSISTESFTTTGTYSIQADGRATASIDNVSQNIRLYLASEDRAITLTIDDFQIIVIDADSIR